METENQSPLSSLDNPSYREDNDACISTPSNSDNLEIPLSTDFSSYELRVESTPAPTDITTHEEHQLTVQSLSAKVVAQYNLLQLVDIALNESTMIPLEDQGESIFVQQPTDTDKVIDLLELDYFYCFLSSSSSLDLSISAKSSPSSSTSNISLIRILQIDILPDNDFKRSSLLCLTSNSEDGRLDNLPINFAAATLLDSSADLPALIKTVNLFVRFVQENLVTTAADATIQRYEC